MDQAIPARRALVDLPVNTFGTPSATINMDKPLSSHKRSIRDVEDTSDYSRPSSRVRVSPPSSAENMKTSTPPTSARRAMPNNLDIADEMDEGDSQNSYKDSMSSLIDFDPDETMTSQQTAATEMTQPLQSRVSQVCLATEYVSRLANRSISRLKGYVFDYGWPTSKSRPIKQISHCLSFK